MRVLRRIVIVLGVVVLMGAGPAVTGAGAATLVCGQTVTQNTVLTADLGPCPAHGLVAGADGITIDLDGHRIIGSGFSIDGFGVYLLNRTGVTVQNGTVRDFEIGVAIEGGSGNTVRAIVARDNYGASGQARGGDGIAILSSSRNRIVGNHAINNGPFSGIGIYSRVDNDHQRTTSGPSTENLIQGNQVIDNFRSRSGPPSGTDNDGIRMENDGVRNYILNNVVRGSGLDGIAVFADNFDHVIQGNTVSGNGFYRSAARRGSGIIVFSRSMRITVEGNTVTGNADNGISIRGPVFTSSGALNNTIRSNTATGNVALPTIPHAIFGPAFDLHDGNQNCDANQWWGNRYGTFSQPCVTTGGQQIP